MSPNNPKKRKFLDRLADKSGLAVVVVNENSTEITVSNNNSMCRVLYSSEEFAPRCAEFCGRAFENAVAAGKTIEYECYAGLTCRAVPVKEAGKQFVAIVGRAFLKPENYREATRKAITGEWKQFRPTEFFENVLMTSSDAELHKVSERLEKFNNREGDDLLEIPAMEVADDAEPEAAAKIEPAAEEPAQPLDPGQETIEETARPSDPTPEQQMIEEPARPPDPPQEKPAVEVYRSGSLRAMAPWVKLADDAQEVAAWRSLFAALMQMDYEKGCFAVLEFLSWRYGFASLVWLERRNNNRLESTVSFGRLADKAVRIGLAADNDALLEFAKREIPFELRERVKDGLSEAEQTLNLFPVVIGGEVRGAIGIEEASLDDAQKRVVSRFAQAAASQLEILRLRNEVMERDWQAQAIKRFNESLRKVDADDFWMHVTQISAELLGAERASLLIRNEKSNDLQAMAAIGSRIDLLAEKRVGGRISRPVLDAGDPVMVADVQTMDLGAAPDEWRYRTASFLSFPILIGDRRIGVLNFTDKAGGELFTDRDLELLQAIAPQIAVAIDRTTLRDRAGEYEQLSVTDPLTGLLNRRYIEERLTEEITRSKRHRFPMSLMMLDVDEFKSYNDSFGHPAGDTALKIVADVLKETLRGADVASRYGGEEFAILLPQTTGEEAAPIAERIRQRIEKTDFPKRRVTVSIGIASFSAEMVSAKDLVSAADIALYEAKGRGRNNVRIFSSFGDNYTENIH